MRKTGLFILTLFLIVACSQNLPPTPSSSSFNAPLGKAIDAYSQGYALPTTFGINYANTEFNFTNNAVVANVGVNGEQYVYKTGYVYNGNSSTWYPFTFPQATVGSSGWISGNVTAPLSITEDYLLNQSLINQSQPIYVVAYACSRSSDLVTWDCHGSVNNPAGEWMLQIINTTITVPNLPLAPPAPGNLQINTNTCSVDSDCSSGQVCSNNVCVTNVATPIVNASSCLINGPDPMNSTCTFGVNGIFSTVKEGTNFSGVTLDAIGSDYSGYVCQLTLGNITFIVDVNSSQTVNETLINVTDVTLESWIPQYGSGQQCLGTQNTTAVQCTQVNSTITWGPINGAYLNATTTCSADGTNLLLYTCNGIDYYYGNGYGTLNNATEMVIYGTFLNNISCVNGCSNNACGTCPPQGVSICGSSTNTPYCYNSTAIMYQTHGQILVGGGMFSSPTCSGSYGCYHDPISCPAGQICSQQNGGFASCVSPTTTSTCPAPNATSGTGYGTCMNLTTPGIVYMGSNQTGGFFQCRVALSSCGSGYACSSGNCVINTTVSTCPPPNAINVQGNGPICYNSTAWAPQLTGTFNVTSYNINGTIMGHTAYGGFGCPLSNDVTVCPSGQICSNGNCIVNTTASTCSSNSDCSTGQICTSGSCVPLTLTQTQFSGPFMCSSAEAAVAALDSNFTIVKNDVLCINTTDGSSLSQVKPTITVVDFPRVLANGKYSDLQDNGAAGNLVSDNQTLSLISNPNNILVENTEDNRLAPIRDEYLYIGKNNPLYSYSLLFNSSVIFDPNDVSANFAGTMFAMLGTIHIIVSATANNGVLSSITTVLGNPALLKQNQPFSTTIGGNQYNVTLMTTTSSNSCQINVNNIAAIIDQNSVETINGLNVGVINISTNAAGASTCKVALGAHQYEFVDGDFLKVDNVELDGTVVSLPNSGSGTWNGINIADTPQDLNDDAYIAELKYVNQAPAGINDLFTSSGFMKIIFAGNSTDPGQYITLIYATPGVALGSSSAGLLS